MTKPHSRDLSAARHRGCGCIHHIKPMPEQFELFQTLVWEGAI